MADVAFTKLTNVNNSDIFDAELNVTDSDTEVLKLNPKKATSIAIKTTGTAVVDVVLYYQDPDDAGARSFIFDAGAGTTGGRDYNKASLGPITGVKVNGTIAGGDTAEVQVIQSIEN